MKDVETYGVVLRWTSDPNRAYFNNNNNKNNNNNSSNNNNNNNNNSSSNNSNNNNNNINNNNNNNNNGVIPILNLAWYEGWYAAYFLCFSSFSPKSFLAWSVAWTLVRVSRVAGLSLHECSKNTPNEQVLTWSFNCWICGEFLESPSSASVEVCESSV